MPKSSIYINGQWLEVARSEQSINPGNGSSCGCYSLASETEIADAMLFARKAFLNWSMTPISIRSQKLKCVADEIRKRKEDIEVLITTEMGKARSEAAIEAIETADMVAFLADHAAIALAGETYPVDESLFPGKFNYSNYKPLGVVLAIKPWNYPFELPAWTLAAAIAAGNTVVLKPSEYSPLVAEMLIECFNSGDFPPGVINLITGGPNVGKAAIKHCPDCISFTGSMETGKEIASMSIGRPTKLLMELGGKDPFIVCSDADLDLASSGAVWGSYTNCGQVCTSAERIILVKNIAADFIELFVKKTSELRIGYGMSKGIDMGPLISLKQMQKVEAHIQDAVKHGGTILHGGKQLHKHGLANGFFFEPTIITGVTSNMKVWNKETFGPVAPIMIVDDETAALEVANDSDYDLGASIWTRSLANSFEMTKRIRVGMVWINDVNVAFPAGPWGGFRKSGTSKELSYHSLFDYSGFTHISVDFNKDTRRPWWYPY
ncbi:putative NAD/NADP-dependent betaine aldehyde dehydrogenase [Candidatus Zixiibacteriota bacterium]|nr:putative NAD/NADP-dependent betaine aldehyde dehydrogenase [candidate division Zixibacteria bacterium]